MSVSKPIEPATGETGERSLGNLLIPQSEADFLRAAEQLVATTDHERLARWWIFMNGHYWPDDVEDPVPLKFGDDWTGKQCAHAQAQVFSLIEREVGAYLLTLHWQAAGNTSQQRAWIAQGKLRLWRERHRAITAALGDKQ